MKKNSNLLVPDASKLKEVQKLCDIENPYEDFYKTDEQFVKAMIEITSWHIDRSDFYKKLSNSKKIDLNQIKSIDDLINIPHLWAHFFKKHEILSINKEDVFLHLTSSGTTGQKSQIFFDEWTIRSAQEMVDKIFNYYNWNRPLDKCNYILFSYQTETDSKLGTSYTDNFLCKYAGVNKVFTALKLNGNGGHEFDVFGTIEKLIEYEKEGLPVRIFGFPAFLFFTLERMKKLNIPPLKLHPESIIFLGGGWKGHAEREINKHQLYEMVHENLGIPLENLKDGFGSVEHCIPYVECENHQFHIPVWSRVFIRDMEDLKVLPYGKQGFLHFVSPYITSVPAHSVIMGDRASLHHPDECSCKLKTPFFKIHGRAGLKKNKSCAITAAELLSEKRV
jgi:phenylacetate-coenzyme A ligase PaaK-like adenylate-forming protein